MNTFWEEKHRVRDTYWLTGTQAHDILNMHNIPMDMSFHSALDIGVGFGYLTRFFHQQKKTVYACDISPIALNNIRSFTAGTFVTNELAKVPPVDLAICHLVFQHCNDAEIHRIIQDVNLTPTGIFSFQFAFLRDGEPLKPRVKELIQLGTHHFRTLDTIKHMVHDSNKEIVAVSEPIHYNEDENFSWLFVMVKNKSS
jgi:SAM-dependent methyltransferase